MRRALIAASAAVLLCITAAAQEQRAAVDGCLATSITCNELVRGRLSADDCRHPDGTRYDVFYFSGSAGQYVKAVLYPVSPALTNLSMNLTSPGPLISGGKGAAITYILPSSGLWALTVGTRDAAASGDYAVELLCGDNPGHENGPGCLRGNIACGQTAEWALTPQSCRFGDDARWAFEEYSFYGIAGQILSAEIESGEFNPRIGIYHGGRGGSPIARSVTISPTKDVIQFTIPSTGLYDIVATSRTSSAFGRFTLTVNDCPSPGCLPPLLIEEPSDIVVPSGTRATLTAKALGGGPLRYLWYDRAGLPVQVAEGQQFTTPPVTTAVQWYSVSATNPCGVAESHVVKIRAARRQRATGR